MDRGNIECPGHCHGGGIKIVDLGLGFNPCMLNEIIWELIKIISLKNDAVWTNKMKFRKPLKLGLKAIYCCIKHAKQKFSFKPVKLFLTLGPCYQSVKWFGCPVAVCSVSLPHNVVDWSAVSLPGHTHLLFAAEPKTYISMLFCCLFIF